MIVSDDIEVWLLFAPFWLLGTAALIGGLWHLAHAWLVTRQAHAAGHVSERAALAKDLKRHDFFHQRRHHLRRGLLWLGTFIALMLLGIGVGAAVGLLLGR